jgi:hypothetical protein
VISTQVFFFSVDPDSLTLAILRTVQ